jgi:menaquinol-cytochrome c reductase iron-sulfur subunit
MSEEKKPRQDMTRRQFLGYTLGGVGGFLAAGMLIPMVRFAVDPALTGGAQTEFVKIGALDQFGPEPVEVKFQIKQVDGWYESNPSLIAWVRKLDDGSILALSPICKHLGCTVTWEGSPDFPERFYCPCHDGLYEINGKNIPGTPPLGPLDQYITEIKDGVLYIGQIIPNQVVKEA